MSGREDPRIQLFVGRETLLEKLQNPESAQGFLASSLYEIRRLSELINQINRVNDIFKHSKELEARLTKLFALYGIDAEVDIVDLQKIDGDYEETIVLAINAAEQAEQVIDDPELIQDVKREVIKFGRSWQKLLQFSADARILGGRAAREGESDSTNAHRSISDVSDVIVAAAYSMGSPEDALKNFDSISESFSQAFDAGSSSALWKGPDLVRLAEIQLGVPRQRIEIALQFARADLEQQTIQVTAPHVLEREREDAVARVHEAEARRATAHAGVEVSGNNDVGLIATSQSRSHRQVNKAAEEIIDTDTDRELHDREAIVRSETERIRIENDRVKKKHHLWWERHKWQVGGIAAAAISVVAFANFHEDSRVHCGNVPLLSEINRGWDGVYLTVRDGILGTESHSLTSCPSSNIPTSGAGPQHTTTPAAPTPTTTLAIGGGN